MNKLVLVVMDGVGKSKTGLGDAVTLANTPTLDKLLAECPHTYIKAHGTAVGLPSDDDMGNSEVGHNALGCGQVYSQGAKLVEEAIESGDIFASSAWQELNDALYGAFVRRQRTQQYRASNRLNQGRKEGRSQEGESARTPRRTRRPRN